jgi:hypothetical protein
MVAAYEANAQHTELGAAATFQLAITMQGMSKELHANA